MKNLDNALLRIKENPSKYIGKKSLDRLILFILGYTISQCDEEGKFSECLKGFQEFVQQKYDIKYNVKYSKIISCLSVSEEQAFDKFYELLEEFHNNQ